MTILTNNGTIEISFKWDFNLIGFAVLYAPEYYTPESEYCGAVFFGDYKLEFIRNDSCTYCNLYQYGAEDIPGSAYAYLPDGTPYEERDELAEQIELPSDILFDPSSDAFGHLDVFATDIELKVCGLICRNEQTMRIATAPTEPDKWYPAGSAYHIKEITREA